MAINSSAFDRHEAIVADTAADDAFDLGWIGRSTGRGERRQVVVLAVGFEPVAARDPEQMVEAQAARRDLVIAVAGRFGGVVSHMALDLHLIAWGWPQAGEADTRFAIAAALEAAGSRMHSIRCGIDAGIAVTAEDDTVAGLGFVGEMIGNAVELQELAGGGEVFVSEAVAYLATPGVQFEARRGAAGLAKFWRVLGLDAVERATRGMGSAVRELVGRSGEMRVLVDAWSAACSGKGECILIEGEAGVGKTALLQWLEHEIAITGGQCILVECRPEVANRQFEPLRQVMHGLSGSSSSAPGRHDSAMAGGLPGGIGAAGSEVGLRAEFQLALAADPPCENATSEAFQALIRATSARRPIALLIEDVHWADPSSACVLAGLIRLAAAPASVLTVLSIRPGNRANAMGADRRWQRLSLERLNFEEISQIVDNCSHADKLTLDMRERIAERASGVPFHALELAQLCAEHSDAEAHHRLLARPNRLNAVLTNRLDALATLKPLAQAAAVLGQVFDCRVLASALEIEGRVIKERLDLLVQMGLFAVVKGHNGWCFRFHDALLWSQAYGSVLKGRRKQLHKKFAGVLEGQIGESVDSEPATIAHHWKKAGQPSKSFGWWMNAALEAAERGEAARAVSFINEALAAKDGAPEVCSPHDEATLMSVLGAQLRVLRGSASRDTVAAYERAMELVTAMPAKPDTLDLEIAWGLVNIHLVRGDVRAANEASSRLLSEVSERGREDMLPVALRVHGTARLLAGHVIEAIDILEDAVARYDRRTHAEAFHRFVSDPCAVALSHLGSAQALAGAWERASDSRKQALVLANATGHAHTIANVLGVLALGAVHMGERGTAAALSRACGEIASQHGFKYWQTRSEVVLAWHDGLRNPGDQFARVLVAVEAYRSTGAGRAAVFAACLAAEIAIKAGRYEEALELLGPVRQAAEQRGEHIYVPEVLRLMALAMACGTSQRLNQAVDLLDRADLLARRYGAAAFVTRIAATRAELAARGAPVSMAAASEHADIKVGIAGKWRRS